MLNFNLFNYYFVNFCNNNKNLKIIVTMYVGVPQNILSLISLGT